MTPVIDRHRTRRTVATVLAAALLAGACGRGTGGGADAGMGPGAPTTAPVATTTPPTATAPMTPSTTSPQPAPTPSPTPTPTPSPTPTPTPGPGAPPTVAAVSARLQLVARAAQPTALAVRAGDDALYVAEKAGRVRRIPGGQGATGPVDPDAQPVLDLVGQVSGGGEQGLLGLVFSPDGGRIYVNYTDTAGDTRVVEYAFTGGRADPSSRRELLAVDQPFPNHNGGHLAFGPDGLLYVALGDGGSGNDPQDNAQNLGTLLGSILRIDPRPSGGAAYTVPAANPFVGRAGARPEIWAYGLRNPWRFSFDRATGDFWVGDVGQNAVEEIDFLPAGHPGGANFGWALLEGSRSVKGTNPPGGVLPIFEYGHDEGCSVTGGHVYRGTTVPTLRGVYVYSDACSATLWGLVHRSGAVVDQGVLSVGGASGLSAVVSFAEDAAGELYVVSLAGTIHRFVP